MKIDIAQNTRGAALGAAPRVFCGGTTYLTTTAVGEHGDSGYKTGEDHLFPSGKVQMEFSHL